MRLRAVLASLCLGLLALLPTPAGAATASFNFCPRQTVGFFQLAAELNHAFNCARPLFCVGVPGDFEVKQIAQNADIDQWLLTTSDPNIVYSPAQQDMKIQLAKSLANANRPAGKFVYEIAFFFDISVPVDNPAYFIGANITYARCIRVVPTKR